MKTYDVQYAFGDRITYEISKVRANDPQHAVQKLKDRFRREFPRTEVEIGQADLSPKSRVSE